MKKIILLASLTFSLSGFAQLLSYVPKNGLVGFWPFSGKANDQSSNGYNGIVSGCTYLAFRKEFEIHSTNPLDNSNLNRQHNPRHKMRE